MAERNARARQEEAARRAAENAQHDLTPDEAVAEVQATLKSGTAFWNEDTGEVEIDYSGSYR